MLAPCCPKRVSLHRDSCSPSIHFQYCISAQPESLPFLLWKTTHIPLHDFESPHSGVALKSTAGLAVAFGRASRRQLAAPPPYDGCSLNCRINDYGKL